MRVISQDGTMDMPYEMSIMWSEDNGAILLQAVGEVGEYQSFAKYSTEEKPRKLWKCLEVRIQEVLPCFRTLSLQKKLRNHSKDAIRRLYVQVLKISHRKLNLRIIKIFISSSQQRKNWSSL